MMDIYLVQCACQYVLIYKFFLLLLIMMKKTIIFYYLSSHNCDLFKKLYEKKTIIQKNFFKKTLSLVIKQPTHIQNFISFNHHHHHHPQNQKIFLKIMKNYNVNVVYVFVWFDSICFKFNLDHRQYYKNKLTTMTITASHDTKNCFHHLYFFFCLGNNNSTWLRSTIILFAVTIICTIYGRYTCCLFFCSGCQFVNTFEDFFTHTLYFYISIYPKILTN